MSHTWPGGFHEDNTSYYAAVGYLCHQWNNVEHFVYSLANETLHLPNKTRSILFRHMGVTSAMVFVLDYASANHPAETQAQLKHVHNFVDRCRINRNLITHGFPENDVETGEQLLRSVPDKNRKFTRTVPISIEAVRRACMECETAGMLLVRAQLLVSPKDIMETIMRLPTWPKDGEKALYAKPPLPVSLAENPQRSPTPKRPRQSSRK